MKFIHNQQPFEAFLFVYSTRIDGVANGLRQSLDVDVDRDQKGPNFRLNVVLHKGAKKQTS